jgi:hypothetical protein
MSEQLLHATLIAVAALVAGGGVLVARRFVPPESLRENNEFTGFTYAFVGLVYGVYLAFTVVIVWEHFAEADNTASHEAIVLNELWRDTTALPDHDDMHRHIYGYTRSVIVDEFPSMAAGKGAAAKTYAEYEAMWETLQSTKLTPGDPVQQAFYAEAVRQMNALTEHRRSRLLSGQADLPPLMWILLIAGGVGMVAFTYLIGTPHRWVQLVVTMFLAAMLTHAILIVASLLNPFDGDITVQPSAYSAVLKSFDRQIADQSPVR